MLLKKKKKKKTLDFSFPRWIIKKKINEAKIQIIIKFKREFLTFKKLIQNLKFLKLTSFKCF